MGAERPAFYSRNRMPIVAFNVTVCKPAGSVQRGFGGLDNGHTILNAHFVSTVLNDVYGIQVRSSAATTLVMFARRDRRPYRCVLC